MMRVARIVCALSLMLPACAREEYRTPAEGSAGLLYVWAGDFDGTDPDFLAVIDARADSPTYGRLISTAPVEGRGNIPHHTEYELAPGRSLFANGWGTGKTFVFDLADAERPKVSTEFGARGAYAYPHSYARLPNGNVLTTFQASGEPYAPPGALVELNAAGELVRATSGSAPGIPDAEGWTYSLLVLADLDRVVTTNTRMGLPDEWASADRAATDPTHHHVSQDVKSTHVQVWRLSDFKLLSTLRLPAQQGGHNFWTAEPRRLANGEVYVNTFSCGLYRIIGVAGDRPTVEPAGSSRFEEPWFCAVPVVVGNFWIQPSATERAIITYDLSEAARPREVARLALDSAFAVPHWMSLDPASPRLVVTGEMGNAWVLIVNVDPESGALSIDERFREPGAARPGISFDRPTWPHGAGGKAQPHGAVFGVKAP